MDRNIHHANNENNIGLGNYREYMYPATKSENMNWISSSSFV